MSFEEEETEEERGFKISEDSDEELLEPIEEIHDFGLDEEDPDRDR